MKKIESVIFSLFIGFSLHSQTLNPTQSIISPGMADSFKGGYTFSYATAGTPWNGALISFGGLDNRYDCQISADYGVNGSNRISFRTRNGDENNGVGIWNSWNELATRGVNNFFGDQIISGNVGIGTTPSAILDVNTPVLTPTTYNTQKWSTGNIDYNLILQTIWNSSGINQRFVQRYNGVDYNSLVFFAGNIGIGKVNPTNKLDVDGTIHSKEVKVDMTGWSDFVFKREYNLPTLEQVEKHIAEKGHLENIPSEEEVVKNGINLGEMNAKLLQKIEELTLYIIEQDKKTENLKMVISKQNERLEKLENKK